MPRFKIENLHDYPEYINTVASWLYEQWGHLSEGDGLSSRIEKLKIFSDDKGLPQILIAIEDGNVVGVARLVEEDMSLRPQYTPWLASVFVPKEHRHKEVGRSLCKAIVDTAKGFNFKELYLFSPDKSHFYTKQGWEFVEEVTYRGESVMIMKNLLF